MNHSIVFVGGGNMASALISGLLGKDWPADNVCVVDPVREQRARIETAFPIKAYASPAGLVHQPDVVIWAVKPEVLSTVAPEATTSMPGALHISIAAGVKISDLCDWLGTERVVRAMPNTAALVSSGVTGLCASVGASASDKVLAEQIMQSTGAVFWVDDDERMNAVTALTGSGPAYVFHFLEGLQHAAIELGFDERLSRELSLRLVEGAVRQALSSDESVSVLRERVTSKGGTTAAALEVLDRRRTQAALGEAVVAAFNRADEIGSSQPKSRRKNQ